MVNLAAGLAHGRVAQAEAVRRVLEQMDRVLALLTPEWKLAEPAKGPHLDWPSGEKERFARQVLAVLDGEIRPALVRYRDFVRDRKSSRAGGPAGTRGSAAS